MAQSTELLYLLDLLDEIDGMSIGFLWGFLHDEVRDGSLSKIFKFLDAEKVKELETGRLLVRAFVKAKREPQRELNDERIKRLFGILQNEGDECLDEHFTRLELQRIPGIVARLKKLRGMPVVLIPGEKVADYLRQATTCYLYGLPNAAAALCRAVLEFALNEKLGALGGISKLIDKVDRKDHLEKLINFARNTKILSDELATKAHNIREVGNNAIHKSACTERQALETIEKMGEILSHVYGRSAQGGR
ncbi:MAG TPA: DUF4145 domain-containing protein [Thermoleophilia bacterium]|nr:DUF4145 domain-containing protein [Thermoleophilia bacterium]